MSVRFAIVLSMSALFCASSFAQAPVVDPERQKAKIVSRTYQMTYGSAERCKQATPAAAAEYQTELTRFVKEHAALMKLVTESPHYAKAREQFARHEKADPARDTPEKLANECTYLASILRSMLDTPDGKQAAKDLQETLTK
jgi:hypothetical protein